MGTAEGAWFSFDVCVLIKKRLVYSAEGWVRNIEERNVY